MPALTDAYVAVKPDTRTFSRDLNAGLRRVDAAPAGRMAGQRFGEAFQSSARATLSRLSTASLGLGAAIGGLAAGAATVGIKTAASMETARIGFETMLGSAGKADKFLRGLSDFAAKTPFEFPELQTAASSLISAGVNADKVIPIMRTLGDVTAGMGTGSEGIQRATVALQQMQAAGRITGEDLNQLRDAGIPVYDLLAKATGRSKEEVVKLAQSGKLGKRELDLMMRALETGAGLERFNGLMAKSSASMSGLWSTLKDTFSQGMATAIAPAIPLIKEGLGGAIAFTSGAMPKLAAGLLSVVGAAQDLGPTFHRISTSARGLVDGVDLGAAFTRFRDALPSLTPLLDATGRGIRLVADHADLLAKAIPFLVAGFAAYKAAQVANNLVGRDSLVGFGLQLASNIALTASNFALARSASAVAAAEGAATATRSRGLAATIAFGVAQHAAAAASKLFAAAQWLVTAAMRANPIGIVVTALAALAAGLVYAYKNSETFRKVVNAIGSAIKTGFLVAVQAVTGWLSRFAAAFNTELIQPVRRAGQAVAEVWEKIKSVTATVFQAIAKVIGGAIQAWLAVIKFELTVIGTAFLLAWELLKFVTKSVFGFIADKIIKPIWKTISTIFSTAQTILAAAWGKFWGALSTVANRVWTAVRDKVIKPIWTTIQTVFTTAFSLLKERWSKFWGALRTAAKAVFEAIRDKVISPIWGNIKTVFSTAHTWVQEKWSGFWGGIKQTAKDAMDKVLERIGTALEKVKTAFSTAKTNIGKAWSGVKSVVSTPIDWIKDNVYNKPLVPVWNRVAKLVDGPTLNAYARGGIAAAERYANGGTYGVRPGYTPGRDTHTIAVGGGEAIMRPEWTRAVGADYVNSANRAARTGGVRKVQEMAAQFRADREGDPGERVPSAAFARGGIAGAMMRSVKGAGKTVLGKLKDWALGGLAAVAGKALNPMKGLIDRAMPASGVGRTVGGIGKKAIDLVLAKIKGADVAPGGGPYGGGGAAVGGGRGAARLAGLRLGASSVGTYPGHQPSMNKAWDFMATGATGNRIAGHLAANRKQYGISYLIWNRRMLRDYPHGNIAPGSWGPYFDGNSSNPNRAHTNHVHASFYRNGGIVPEGGLAQGGVVKGGRGGVTTQVGEGRFDELVAPLPRGWKMGAGKDDAVDRLIAAIESHGLGSTEFSFVTHNPIAEPQSVTTNKALQRVSNLGLV